MRRRKIIVTCEHAGNYIPKDYKFLFLGKEEVLNTHKGWDPGALGVAKYLARQLEAPFFFQKISRLLVESNRSLHSKELFSPYSQVLEKKIKKEVLDKYYFPYRNSVEERITKELTMGESILHISVHSFTPVMNGIERKVDIGILYDDLRTNERVYSKYWKERLDKALSEYVIMPNLPYHGADDGFTTYLRTRYSDTQYLGIEIEINQKHVHSPDLANIQQKLALTLKEENTSLVDEVDV